MHMDFQVIKEWMTIDNIMELIEKYRSFGPLPGIFLLTTGGLFSIFTTVFICYGQCQRIWTWLGIFTFLGWGFSGFLSCFFIIRRFGNARLFRFLHRKKQVQSLMSWVERHGFGPLFLMLCFPFTPSALVNIVAGLSKISIYQYMLAVMSGKAVMIFIMSFIGYDIVALIKQPVRTAIVLGVIGILWFVGKKIEGRLKEKVQSRGESTE